MSGRTCLIVDDDPAIRGLLRAVLQPLQLQILEAGNAAHALKIFQDLGGHLDLLVSDINMPGDMNGVDLAHSVRNACPAIPVVLISSYSEKGTGNVAGFECVPKPFTLQKILNVVEKAVNSHLPT